MSRKLRLEYPGAMYHVMNRGDQPEDIFRDDEDRRRFLSTVVGGSGNGYLRTVCDYVHLNPVRAGLLKADVPLESFRWSNYGQYLKPSGQRPAWLRVDRLLGEKGIPNDSEAGRKQFALLMEQRRAEKGAAAK